MKSALLLVVILGLSLAPNTYVFAEDIDEPNSETTSDPTSEEVQAKREQAINQIREELDELESLTKEYAETKSEAVKERIDVTLEGIEDSIKDLKNDGEQLTQEIKTKLKEDLSELLGKGRAKKGMLDGDMDEGELEIGQVSAMVHDVPSCQELMDRLILEYNSTLSMQSRL
ncbi:hypothetical protein N9W79_00465 [bacterium]|nr:hypothetical protein [bacterium]